MAAMEIVVADLDRERSLAAMWHALRASKFSYGTRVATDSGVVRGLLNARYYDSARGQFLTEDPVFWSNHQNLFDPQSLNSYSYAEDNPITKIDPDGQAASLAGIISSLRSFVASLQSFINSLVSGGVGSGSGGGGGSGGSGSKSSGSQSTSSGGGIVVPNVISNKAWVSQWSLSNPSTACRDACDQMGPPTGADLTTVIFVNGKPVVQPDARKSLDVINRNLLGGKSVTLGVNMDSVGDVGNVNNPSTNHFIKVVGANVDQNGQYYNFFDPGTHDQGKGTSPQNRLYVQPDDTLKGTSAYHDSVNYVVTEVP
jgi:RHS repeat-associated protein